MSRPGSNAITRLSSPAPCSTPSPWASTHRRRSCAAPASMASRRARPTSITAPGTARSSRRVTAQSLCAASRASPDRRPARGRRGDTRRGTRRTPYRDVRDLWRRSGVGRGSLEKLASADAFRSLGLDRRQALWDVRGLPQEIPLPLFDHADAAETGDEPHVALPAHAAVRACGERLPYASPLPQSAPDELPARPRYRRAHRLLRRTQTNARRRARQRRRRHPGAPASGLGGKAWCS